MKPGNLQCKVPNPAKSKMRMDEHHALRHPAGRVFVPE